MTGYSEFNNDDQSQYASQNRPATRAEEAAIKRLTSPQEAAEASQDVQRLLRLHQDKNVKPPTSQGARRVGETAAVRRAHARLRGDLD